MYGQADTVHPVRGGHRSTCEKSMSYLGCNWDFSENYFVEVSLTGMIQDLVASRERTHAERGTKLTGVPLLPGAPYLLDLTPDCTLLNARDAKTFHTDVAFLPSHFLIVLYCT